MESEFSLMLRKLAASPKLKPATRYFLMGYKVRGVNITLELDNKSAQVQDIQKNRKHPINIFDAIENIERDDADFTLDREEVERLVNNKKVLLGILDTLSDKEF